MRLVDDVSDEPGDLRIEASRAGAVARMLDDAVAGNHAAGQRFCRRWPTPLRGFEIPTRYFHDLILGAEMDLTVDTTRRSTSSREYCYRVAGTVGPDVHACFWVSAIRRRPDLAERLGLAFQLTNIIRDVGSDDEMGRVYFPQEDLERFGCARKICTRP